jgi:hypothetical protein
VLTYGLKTNWEEVFLRMVVRSLMFDLPKFSNIQRLIDLYWVAEVSMLILNLLELFGRLRFLRLFEILP